MKRVAGILLWTVVFFALLLAIDQLLVRVPLEVRGLREIRTFYIDFRARILTLRQPQAAAAPRKTGESAGEKNRASDHGGKPVRKTPAAASPRFVYSDEAGNLQFAGSLKEVPERFRQDAKPLEP